MVMILVIVRMAILVMVRATISPFSSVCLEYSPPISPHGSFTPFLHIYTAVNASSKASLTTLYKSAPPFFSSPTLISTSSLCVSSSCHITPRFVYC